MEQAVTPPLTAILIVVTHSPLLQMFVLSLRLPFVPENWHEVLGDDRRRDCVIEPEPENHKESILFPGKIDLMILGCRNHDAAE
jgi:hypothetical protein